VVEDMTTAPYAVAGGDRPDADGADRRDGRSADRGAAPGPGGSVRPVGDPAVGRSWPWAVLLGLVATGAGLGAAELVVGLVQGASSPVVPVGQEFIDRTPPALKDWAISTFGTNNKLALLVGALLVVGLLGTLVGRAAVRGQLATALALTTVTGIIGAWAVILRPEPTFVKLLPAIVGTLVSAAVVYVLAPRRTRPGPPDGAVEPVTERPSFTRMGANRRSFLQGAAGIGSLAAISGGIGTLLQRRFEIDSERSAIELPSAVGPTETFDAAEASRFAVDGMEPFITPTADFYRIDTAIQVPQVSRDDWSLQFSGLVDEERRLTFDDLLAMPQVERMITLSCVSNEVGGDLVGNAVWQGVLLRPLLEELGVQPGAEQLVSRSIDGWTAGSPMEVIMDGRDAMIAIAMNGEPLPARHGYPARLVVPGLYGYVSATKWVTDIRLTGWDDFDAYWVPRGWSKRGPVKTMARIDTPRGGRRQGPEVAIGGLAWAVHRGVSRVQVRVDDGEWRDAEIGSVPRPTTPGCSGCTAGATRPPGRHAVEARAVDGDGVVQPEGPAPVAPNGAEGYHRVQFTVE
jgi:DMSO/TMAO reductase YedYZ molybdopterin-dependent catalytic subunit